jgi:type I restriction enzyme M protein
LNKDKPKAHKDKVLMLDARGVYRKVTRKIFDFSPEQLANLTAIVWLHRGQSERFVALVANHLASGIKASEIALKPVEAFVMALKEGREAISPLFKGKKSDAFAEFDALVTRLHTESDAFAQATAAGAKAWANAKRDNEALKASAKKVAVHGQRRLTLESQWPQSRTCVNGISKFRDAV